MAQPAPKSLITNPKDKLIIKLINALLIHREKFRSDGKFEVDVLQGCQQYKTSLTKFENIAFDQGVIDDFPDTRFHYKWNSQIRNIFNIAPNFGLYWLTLSTPVTTEDGN